MIVRWLINTLIILALPYLIPGITVHSFWTALVVAFVLGVFNAFVRPFLILLTLPITILSLGASILVLNAFLLWLTSAIVKGFDVRGFWPALLGALFIWLCNSLANAIIQRRPKNKYHIAP